MLTTDKIKGRAFSDALPDALSDATSSSVRIGDAEDDDDGDRYDTTPSLDSAAIANNKSGEERRQSGPRLSTYKTHRQENGRLREKVRPKTDPKAGDIARR